MSIPDLTGEIIGYCVKIKKNIFSPRDQYVRINWENIVSGQGHNFEKKNPSYVLLHGSYDYGSVMHYSTCGFSSNGWETITTIVRQHFPIILIFQNLSCLFQDPSANIGQRNGMSQIDVDKLMNYYECD